jgi:quinol monooxygenase YgiN
MRSGAALTAMLLIIGTIRLPLDKLDIARPVMAEILSASRAEDGCVAYSYAEDVIEPGLIHVSELWRDQATLDRHFASEHIARWRAEWPGLGIGERHLTVYDVGEPRPV